MTNNVQKIPTSIKSETIILSAILDDPKKLLELTDTIEPSDFSNAKNKTIFSLLVEMWNAGNPIDTITLGAKAKSSGVDKIIGGSVGIDELLDMYGFLENLESHVQIVRDTSQRRKLMTICKTGYLDSRDKNDFQKVLDATSQGVLDISLDVVKEVSRPFTETIPKYKRDLRESVDNPDKRKIYYPTGLPSLDAVIDGFAPKMFDIVAARPGIGKTSLSLQMAYNVALQGQPVIFVSLEMWAASLINRIVANLTDIDSRKLMWGNMTESELQRVESLNLDNLPFVIEDKIYSLQQIWSRCRYWKHHYGNLGLVVVDFIQRIQGPGQSYERISQSSRSLAQLAKQLDCAVLGLSQIGRKGADKPQMRDIEGSGVIEQDGHRIMIIHRDKNMKFGDRHTERIKLTIEKNKHGASGGVIDLNHTTKFNRFIDPETLPVEREVTVPPKQVAEVATVDPDDISEYDN